MNERIKALYREAVGKDWAYDFDPEIAERFAELVAAQREWVGLTDEEISRIDWKPNETLHEYARHIEAKLKEKNA